MRGEKISCHLNEKLDIAGYLIDISPSTTEDVKEQLLLLEQNINNTVKRNNEFFIYRENYF